MLPNIFYAKKVQIYKNDYFGVFFYILFVRKETEISTKKTNR